MSLNPDRIKGKNCVVTGGAGSMGFDVATRYAQYGARTFLIDFSPAVAEKAAQLTALGYDAYGIRLDITDHDAVIAAFDKIVAEFGPIFALCNCAGIGENCEFEKTTPENASVITAVSVPAVSAPSGACPTGPVRPVRISITEIGSKNRQTQTAATPISIFRTDTDRICSMEFFCGI